MTCCAAGQRLQRLPCRVHGSGKIVYGELSLGTQTIRSLHLPSVPCLCLTAPIALPAHPPCPCSSRVQEVLEKMAGVKKVSVLQAALLAGCVTRTWTCLLPTACTAALPGTLALCAMRLLPTVQRFQLASCAAESVPTSAGPCGP